MAIQGSQNLSSVTIRQPDLVAQDREADYDAFSEVSNTAVLGDLPTVHNDVLVRCPTVADIPNLSLNDGDAVSLLGYYALGDGGGQILRYDANSSAVVDSGFVFNGPNGGRLIAIDMGEANAIRWGLRHNDTTSAQATINNAQLQAALNSNAQSVFIPAISGITSYYLTTGITIPQFKLLRGGGWNTRIRPLSGTASGSSFVFVNSYSNIENITFQGAPAGGGSSTGDGVVISGGVTTVDFNRVYSLQWGNGFVVKNSYVIGLTACRASANLAAGLKLGQAACNAIEVSKSEFQGNREGIDLGATATQVSIYSSTIQGNTNYGIGRTANVINNAVTIADNYFESNGRSHIRTESGIIMGGRIEGNNFASTVTLNPVYITRWDGVTFGINKFAGTYSGNEVSLGASCLNGVLFPQSLGNQTSGSIGTIAHTTGTNTRIGF